MLVNDIMLLDAPRTSVDFLHVQLQLRRHSVMGWVRDRTITMEDHSQQPMLRSQMSTTKQCTHAMRASYYRSTQLTRPLRSLMESLLHNKLHIDNLSPLIIMKRFN